MPHVKDDRNERDFYKKPGGGLIDPQGEPPINDRDARDLEPPPRDLDKKDRERRGS